MTSSTAPNPTNARSLAPVPSSAPRAGRQLDLCPWCGQAIAREKFVEIEKRIREEERKRLAAFEANLRQQFATQAVVIRKQAEEAAAQKVKGIQEQAARGHQEELKKLRQVLTTANDQALLKKQAEFNRDREALQKKVKEMERKLSQTAAHEVGDGAEIDLYEALREAFPGDRITRVPKGQPGGDILHEVIHKGEACSRILVDSKNRQNWHNTFVGKLREDKIAAKADHAVLATLVFPAGKKELSLEDGVIVVSPARVVHIVTLLRLAALKMHVQGLSLKERTSKMTSLYKFITSDTYARLSEEATKLTEQILEVDVDEVKEHEKVWKTRGRLATRLKSALREIDTEVGAILEGAE